jgi:hypothetical protein
VRLDFKLQQFNWKKALLARADGTYWADCGAGAAINTVFIDYVLGIAF